MSWPHNSIEFGADFYLILIGGRKNDDTKIYIALSIFFFF